MKHFCKIQKKDDNSCQYTRTSKNSIGIRSMKCEGGFILFMQYNICKYLQSCLCTRSVIKESSSKWAIPCGR